MKFAAIAVILGLLACVVALVEVARRTRLPYPTLMVVAGLLISFIPGLPRPAIDPDVVFLVFLPPILYAAAWNTWLQDFRRHAVSIGLLAVGLVLFTALVVSWVVTAIVPGMPWWVGFLLGAIVSPPDAAAASAICQRLGVGRRIVTVLEGESLVNDASGLTAYRVAVIAVAGGGFSAVHAGRDLVIAVAGGVCMGLLVGWIFAQAHKRVREATATTALSLLAPYAAYLPAEYFHVSGVLATVAAGLYVSSKSPQIFSASARMQAVHVWELLVLLLNGLIFVLIGLQLSGVLEATRGYSPLTLAWYALAVSTAVLVARIIWVFPVARLARLLTPASLREPSPTWQQLAVVGWTGMRGIVSLAAALALPVVIESPIPHGEGERFPFRDLIILLTFAVIFATLVVQSLTLPLLIRALGESVREVIEHEELVARMVGGNAALKALDQLAGPGPDAPDVTRVRAEYLDRVELASAEVLGDEFDSGKGRGKREDRVRRIAIDAERRAIVELRDRGELSEEVFRRIERDLDLEESRLV